MSLPLPVLQTYGGAVLEARVVADVRGFPVEAMELRAVACELTETGGQNMANDGLAYHPDPKIRRPGWDRDEYDRPLAPEVLARCFTVLRRSLILPHYGVGNNGGSTGPNQQLSKDFVRARWPEKTWGWGSLEDTMNLRVSPRMFLAAVVITDDPVYRHPSGGKPILTADPVLADVLRVQNPKLTESSANYGGGKMAAVRGVLGEVREWLRSGGKVYPDALPPQDQQSDNQWFTTCFGRRPS